MRRRSLRTAAHNVSKNLRSRKGRGGQPIVPEPLERRQLLSAAIAPLGATIGITANASDIGGIGLHASRTLKGAVGVTNTDVVYKLEIGASVNLGLTLTKLTQQDEVHLLYSDGTAVNTGYQNSGTTLKISQHLDPGTYYIDVQHGFVAAPTVIAATTKPKVTKIKHYHIKATDGYTLAVKGLKPDNTIPPTEATVPATFGAAFGATGAGAEPGISQALAGRSGFVKFQEFSTGYQLWGAGGPVPDDIIQRFIGDCYFMSVISQIARIDPGLIEQSIVPEGNGDYLVKFHNNGQEVDQQVDDMFPVNSQGQTVFAGIAADGALWPSVLEKAWAYYRPESNSPGTYDGIEEGHASESLFALGSTDATDVGTTNFTSAQQLLNALSSDLQAGDVTTVGTINPENQPDPLATGLFKGHYYSVIASNPGANTVELRNPWGTNSNGGVLDGTNGYITITGDQLLQSIDVISKGTVPGATPNPTIVVTPTPTPTPNPTTTTTGTTQTIAGQLGPNSFQATDGTNYDLYTFTANSSGQADISVASSDFAPELLIAEIGAGGTPVSDGTDPNNANSGSADVKLTVTPGVTYEIGVFTGTNSTGAYTLTLNGDLTTPTQQTPAVSTGSLSGVVYNDANADGSRDNGEVGVAGFTVFLDLNNTGQFADGDPTATTDANGVYTFTSLTPGTYAVVVEPANGWTQTSPAANAAGTGTVAAGQNTTVSPFGESQTSAGDIAGRVYADTNGNGTQDNGEPGLAGWYVYIDVGNTGSYVTGDPYTTSDANGDYSFQGLAAGAYTTRIYPMDGYTTTQGADGWTATVVPGQTSPAGPFGEIQPTATLAGIVYNDANGNGVQDAGETGAAGWTVYIDVNNTGSYATGDPYVTTDSTGAYTFTGLSAGTHITRIIPASGSTTTQGSSGWAPVAIAGQSVNGGPFGETQVTGALAGTVYDDLNGDGVREGNEPGISQWPIYIDVGNTGSFVTGDPFVYTDANGGYSFPGLQPGNYIIRAIPGTGWRVTEGASGWTGTVVANQTSPGGDFGEH